MYTYHPTLVLDNDVLPLIQSSFFSEKAYTFVSVILRLVDRNSVHHSDIDQSVESSNRLYVIPGEHSGVAEHKYTFQSIIINHEPGFTPWRTETYTPGDLNSVSQTGRETAVSFSQKNHNTQQIQNSVKPK